VNLASLVMTVQADSDCLLPRQQGRAVHAQFLRWVAAQDAALAQRWHDEDGPKPFTCSGLVGLRRQEAGLGLAVGQQAWLRLTALDEPTSRLLAGWAAQPPPTLELEEQPLTLLSATLDEQQHPWARQSSYDTFAAPHLLAVDAPPRQLRLSFVTPTTFQQGGKNQPLPTPEAVFGSLADRWNAFSPLRISPELREYARLGVVLNRFRVKSRAVRLKDGGLTLGCVGVAEYKALRYDRYWQSLLALLAEYSFFAGVGRMTAQGLGQARRLPLD